MGGDCRDGGRGVCVGVLCGGRTKEGWGRGQALELTDLEDYIKTTQLSIIWQREQEAEAWGYDLKRKS